MFRQSIAAQDEPGLELYRDGAKDAAGSPVPLVDGTLLVDRFVLVGTELQPTPEVRYQRSRSKVRPQSSKDSLGATDLDKQPFVEPTQALSFISGLRSGGFAVVLAPTQVADVSRWQIFVENSETPLIDCYGIDRSTDGLFDLAGTPAPDTVDAGGFAGAALKFVADDDHLEMHAPPLGPAFTVEAWLKVAPDAPDAELALFGSDADGGAPAKSGLAAWISEGTRLRIGFGDGTAWPQSTTGDVLSPGSWNHAIAFDGSYLRVYVDGVLRHRDGALEASCRHRRASCESAPRRARSAACSTRCACGGSPGRSRHRRLDEPAPDRPRAGPPGLLAPRRRLRRRRLGRRRLAAADRRVRLRPRLGHVRRPHRRHPQLHPQRARVFLRIATSGLTASSTTSRSGRPAATTPPLASRSRPRAMLAMATSDGENPGEIVVLDFGVGTDGRLAQAPTELFLPKLDKADTPAASLEQQLARAAELQTEIAALEQSVSDGRLAIRQLTLVNQIEQVPSSVYPFDLSELPSGLRASLLAYATSPTGAPRSCRRSTR